MCFKDYEKIATFIGVGESGGAKSATLGRLVCSHYHRGMQLLEGDGMTSNCITQLVIDPNLKEACMVVEVIQKEEILARLTKCLSISLVAESKNIIASLPVNDDNAFEVAIVQAVERRAKLPDEKFRVHRLFVGNEEQYHEILAKIFRMVLRRAAEVPFRSNYQQISKKSKQEATQLVEQLVTNVLDEKVCKLLIDELLTLIERGYKDLILRTGYVQDDEDSLKYIITNLDADHFTEAVRIVSNSEKKELVDCPSVACVIKSVSIFMPGDGIKNEANSMSAYRVIDIVGFTNDGLDKVNELINNAMLVQFHYDGIIYFASTKTILKTHESFLRSIFQTIRPSKLIIISPFMDKDAIFDEDDIPTEEQIIELNRRRTSDLLMLVKKVATEDMHVILPEKEDIICISNKVNVRKHGEPAVEIYGSNQYDLIRSALERAVKIIRKKIYIGLSRTEHYLVPPQPVGQIVGLIINKLGNAIDCEYSDIRDHSSAIHHWTIDALLWHLCGGSEHSSNALVWRNVHITTFSGMKQVCIDSLGTFKFSASVKIGNAGDIKRIREEFMANLETELYWVVRNLILYDSNDCKQYSKYKVQIRNLALQSKYNKWKIIDDLRLCLLNAISQKSYLETLINNAIDKALLQTYDKILY